MSSTLIIDSDPAIGLRFRDVDDALAILYALAPESGLDLAAVTAVFGNAPLDKALGKAREVVRSVGRSDLPVLAGAADARSLGEPTEASEFLVESVRARPGAVTVLAIGPLTNVATAGMTDPSFYKDLEALVVMGGALEKGLGLPFVSPIEFNFLKDARAAELVLAAPCEKVVVTGDLCMQVVFGRMELEALYAKDGAAARYLAPRIEPWLRLNAVAPFLPWKGGFVPWDPIAAVYLTRPELFECETTGLRMRPGRVTTGAIERCESPYPCTLPVRVQADEFLRELVGAL